MSGDSFGVLLVYAYVAILLFLSEKLLRKYPFLSRKFLHIMVGNIFFILPVFETKWVMVFIAAAPFILFTFLVSPFSPLKIVSGTSASGHGLGLVYYALAWTILAYAFFNRPEIIAVGIVAMSYGDGCASLVGTKYGKITYKVWGDSKTIEGSFSMLIITLLITSMVLVYYNSLPLNFPILLSVASVATFVEAITPRGLDNLTVSFSASFIYYALV